MNFRLEPYLWLHLAGLAVLPVWLLLVWLGIAAGDPFISASFEVFLLILIGIAPLVWMQWTRPFYFYSLLLLSLPANVLTTDQRKILGLLKGWRTRILSLVAAVGMVVLLWQLYRVAPLAATASPISPRWHIVGFGLAAIAFFLSNLFIQVPASIIGILLTTPTQYQNTESIPPEQIRQNFTVVGFPVRQILPPLTLPSPALTQTPTTPSKFVSQDPPNPVQEEKPTTTETSEDPDPTQNSDPENSPPPPSETESNET